MKQCTDSAADDTLGLESEMRGFILLGDSVVPAELIDGKPVWESTTEPRLLHVAFDGKWGGYTALELIDGLADSMPDAFGLIFVASDTLDYPESDRVYVLRDGRLLEADARRVEWPGETPADLEAHFTWRHVEQYWRYRSPEERAEFLDRWPRLAETSLETVIGETTALWGSAYLPELEHEEVERAAGAGANTLAVRSTGDPTLVFHAAPTDANPVEDTIARIGQACGHASGMLFAVDSPTSIRAFGFASSMLVELPTLRPDDWNYFPDVQFFLGYKPRS